MNLVVGVAEMAVSRNPDDVIATYSLGSCIGLTLYDPGTRVGGLIHCMLPASTIDPQKARTKPEMFIDTGVVLLLTRVLELGAEKRRLVVKAAGAARLLNSSDIFRIGERNHAILKKVLEKNGLGIQGEDVGGTVSRTVFLKICSGETVLKCCGKEVLL